ncbi:MAG: replicative DNA helicase [Planctomycetota bacterium]
MEGQTSNNGNSNGKRGKFKARPTVETSRLFDRLPPHSLEAEMSLLGSLLLDPNKTADVLMHVRGSDDFYRASHGYLFKVMVDLYDRSQAMDIALLLEAVRDADQLANIGGEEYLETLAEAVPSAANAVHYAKVVAQKSRLRKLIDAAGEILYDAFHPGDGVGDTTRDILDRAESKIFSIAERSDSSEAESLAELLNQELERLESIEGTGVSGLKTGFLDFDDKTSGLQDAEMIIIAARPSMGKTALALNIAEQVALGGKAVGSPGGGAAGKTFSVAFFSLEMSRQSVVSRMLSARSGVDSHKMRTGKWSSGEFQKLIRAAGELSEAPIFVDDTPGLTLMQLRSRARRLVQRHQVKCILIDYLQLLSSPSHARESRQVEVSEISRGIKSLARELQLPVVCLAQLNRGPESRDGNRPRLSDLRESGSIEQDADVVCLLHREEYYHVGDAEWEADNPDKVGLAELIIAKQRNGPTGTVKLTWDNTVTRFKNHAGDHWADNAGYAGGYDQQAGAPSWAPAVQTPAAPPTMPGPPAGKTHGERRSTFHPGTAKGPAENHRDGGGPDAWDEDDGIPI